MASSSPTRSRPPCSTSHLVGFLTSSKDRKENGNEKQTQLARRRPDSGAVSRSPDLVERPPGPRPGPLESAGANRRVVVKTIPVPDAGRQSRDNRSPSLPAPDRSETASRQRRSR